MTYSHPLIAGVDEAGRGPLAGPVVCAAVILPDDFSALDQLDDSKKLSEKRRTALARIIRAEARVGVGIAEPVEIDRLNVLHATLAAMDFTPPPLTVAATTSHSTTWPSHLEAVGTIRAARGVELSAEASGEVIAIHVESGQQLAAGDAILTLNDSVEQASKKRQEANLKLARLLYERDARLVKQKSIPQSQYDRSQADLDSAIAQLAETEARLLPTLGLIEALDEHHP